MSDPALVPFQFDTSDNKHNFDTNIHDELNNLSDDGTIPDEDIYDAINDETFGVETSMLSTNDNDDLADFSIRTANLSLLDDSPTTSTKPPNPSQIPIPKKGCDHSFHFVSSKNEQRSGTNFKNANIEALFNRSKESNNPNVDIDASPSIWNGTFNGINSLLDIYKEQEMFSHPMFESSEKSPLTDSWSQARHANICPPFFGPDLGKLLREAIANSSDVVAQGADAIPINANDLERKLLEESIRNSSIEKDLKRKELSIQCQQQEKEQLSSVLPSPSSQISQRTSEYPQHFNTILQHLPANFHQTLQQIRHPLSLPSPSIPPPPLMLPPGVSPLQFPLFNPTAFLQHSPHPDIARAMALHAAASTQQSVVLQSGRQSIVTTPHFLPPTSLHQHPPQNLNHLRHMQIHSPNFHGQQAMLAMVPASLHPQIEKQQSKKLGSALPSGKTISDFALDPYAGLLSTKEREWLIKIHLIQCLGTGDPMTDDYYYTVWKQRNNLKKAPETWQKDARPPRYYSFDATFPSRDYIAPSFAGALGKLTHCSSSQPRQILSVHNDNADDDASVDLSCSIKQTSASRQKRLRLMLIKIENAAIALVDCRDIRRKLRFFEETAITEFIDKHEIIDRVERFAMNIAFIDTRIFAADQLPTVMLIQKGRQLVYDWLQFLCRKEERTLQGTNDKFIIYLSTVIETMNKWAKKICDDDSIQSFATDFCTLFTQITSKDELLSLLRFTNIDSSLIKDSKIIQSMLLSLLTALIQLWESNDSILAFQQLEDSGIYFFLFHMPVSHCFLLPEKMNNNNYFSGVINWNFIKCWINWTNEQWKFINGKGFADYSVAQKIRQDF